MVTRVHNWHTELCRAECSCRCSHPPVPGSPGGGYNSIETYTNLQTKPWYRYGNFDHNLLGAALVIYTCQGTSWCGNNDHYIVVQWNICTSKFSCSKLADNRDRRWSWDSNKEVFTRKKGPQKYLQLCKISRSWAKDRVVFLLSYECEHVWARLWRVYQLR